MKEIIVNKENQGQRFDKYLSSLLSGASFSFIQKMLRKKNIVLNDTKAKGNEKLKENDVIKIYFKDETYDKFAYNQKKEDEYEFFKNLNSHKIKIIYEDKEMLVIDKPFGVLSQKSSEKDISLNELAISYLIQNGLSKEEFLQYKPSVINRLDRNTGGLIICAKNKHAAIKISRDIKEKKIRKIYYCIVHGKLEIDRVVSEYYHKDENNNIAYIGNEKNSDIVIETRIKSLLYHESTTLLEAELYTGKSHQIRLTCSHLGHPILNDKKYGDIDKDEKLFKDNDNRLPGQYLYSAKIIFDDKLTISSKLPKEFKQIGEIYGDMVIQGS